MLRWRDRAEERIGRVGGLESAVAKISLVAEPMRPGLTVDERSHVERVLRAQNITAGPFWLNWITTR